MKFLDGVYCFMEYMYSEFKQPAFPLRYFITFCSRCGMEWDTVGTATDDSILSLFITWYTGATSPL